MHIRDYQQWLEEWDKARTWDRVLPSHTLLHALEELGEVSKLVQMIEGYRAPTMFSTRCGDGWGIRITKSRPIATSAVTTSIPMML